MQSKNLKLITLLQMKLLRYNLPAIEINAEDIESIEGSTSGIIKVYTKKDYYYGYLLK